MNFLTKLTKTFQLGRQQNSGDTVPQKKQLLVDISELVQRDARSGIQRVVRSILRELLDRPPEGFRVEPVYATRDRSYRYATRYAIKSLNLQRERKRDEPVRTSSGDIFLGLDYQADIIPKWPDFFAECRRTGTKTFFVLYDLLTCRHPEWFPSGENNHSFVNWLKTIALADGVISISQATADDFSDWVGSAIPAVHSHLQIGWFHIGADIAASLPSSGMTSEFSRQFETLQARPFILMVGTVEPRKGHAQAVAAFELIWNRGIEVNLAIVGNKGWRVDTLAEQLKHHTEKNKRIFWFQGISDEALLKLYTTATGVLMASEGEGFGLPLIEAAQHGCPIIARDIKVFREVAGSHASYFSGTTPEALADAMAQWLSELKAGKAPLPENMPWLTWKQSTQLIVELITDADHPNWVYEWPQQQVKKQKNR